MPKPDPAQSEKRSKKDATADHPPLRLDMPIQFVPGVGPKRGPLFERLGVYTAHDLLFHFPHRHEYEHAEATIGELAFDQVASARGEIAATRVSGRGRSARFEATLEDESGRLLLTWFNSSYLRRKLHPGMTIRVQGKTKRHAGYLQIINPKWELLDPEKETEARTERYRPVYPATEDLPSEQIDKVIQGILDEGTALIEDHLPKKYRQSRELPSLAESLRLMHAPSGEPDVENAKRRLALDELLLLQLGVSMRRHELRHTSRAMALPWNAAIHQHIIDRFPFPLTDSQVKVIEEIRADLAEPIPMNRMLQGDVGAGKTVVALYAMLMAVASRHQAALMAPTELLAEQHFISISEMLAGSTVKIDLLTGSLTATERDTIRARLASGETDLIIGTHALLSESVNFDQLALVVIDEQHRFGVEQRATLRERVAGQSDRVPHTLVMTATPIPRTLSLTLFGDLDVSTIRGLPPGRTPITTKVVTAEKMDTVYEYLAKRLRNNNEQAYIVLPAIDETSNSDLRDVRSHMKWLENGPFEGLHLAAIHGRLKRDTRERIMHRFRRGKIDVLVATTVIEVGVDVPNASIMVVQHAERFGLSQLHQLRGRVGRGTKQSICTFIGDPTTEDAKARLEAIAATTDGFEIAEKDFEIRGMGEIFGTRQSGLAPFRIAQLPRDLELLNLARRDARKWIDHDPDLRKPTVQLLRTRLLNMYGSRLGIGDVG